MLVGSSEVMALLPEKVTVVVDHDGGDQEDHFLSDLFNKKWYFA